MDMSEEAAFPVDYYGAPTVNIGDWCLRSHRRIRERALLGAYVILHFTNTLLPPPQGAASSSALQAQAHQHHNIIQFT